MTPDVRIRRICSKCESATLKTGKRGARREKKGKAERQGRRGRKGRGGVMCRPWGHPAGARDSRCFGFFRRPGPAPFRCCDSLKVVLSQNTLDAVFDPFIVLYAFYRMCGAWGKWRGPKWTSAKCEKRCARSLHHRTSRCCRAAGTKKCPPECTITRDLLHLYPSFELDFVN